MKAVIFDMDGLMFDTERLVQYSWNQAGRAMGKGDSGEEIYHTLGYNKEKRREYFKNLYGDRFDFETFQILSSLYYYRYVQKYGIPVKKGLYELLDYLIKNHYQIALATSSSHQSALKLLRATGIDGYFSVMITGDQVQHSKPDPEIYQRACDELKIKPSEGIALEDSYHGLQAAHACGLGAIFVPDLVLDDEPVRDIILCKCDSLLDVITYLENITPKDYFL